MWTGPAQKAPEHQIPQFSVSPISILYFWRKAQLSRHLWQWTHFVVSIVILNIFLLWFGVRRLFRYISFAQPFRPSENMVQNQYHHNYSNKYPEFYVFHYPILFLRSGVCRRQNEISDSKKDCPKPQNRQYQKIRLTVWIITDFCRIHAVCSSEQHGSTHYDAV